MSDFPAVSAAPEAGSKAGSDDQPNICRMLAALAEGDQQALEGIWADYYQQLVRYARRQLEGLPRRVADEEDVAQSAINSFYQGMITGRFRELQDRQSLWRLLLTITARKAARQWRSHQSLKRGQGKVRGESAFINNPDQPHNAGLAEIQAAVPTPECAALVAESCRRLLDVLGEERLREIALMKLEGYANCEIAAKFQVVERTVERKLERIRAKWSQLGDGIVVD